MSMSIQIRCLNGGSNGAPGTGTDVSNGSFVFGLDDAVNATTNVSIPTSTGTNFSFVKSFQTYIVAHNSLHLSGLMVGRVSAYSISPGVKLWAIYTHAQAGYTKAVSAPSATADNNVTAPTLNGGASAEIPLIASATAYFAGPEALADSNYVGNMVETSLGADNTCVVTGLAQAACQLKWQWTEG